MSVRVGQGPRRATDICQVEVVACPQAQRAHALGHRHHVQLGGDAEAQRGAQGVLVGMRVRIDQAQQQRAVPGIDPLHAIRRLMTQRGDPLVLNHDDGGVDRLHAVEDPRVRDRKPRHNPS